ncbi:MAG: hypothetical protein LH629_00860 [Ignavibacteria bacterium]|nr:hypothetical protein [Ignavibacteria bacterium]
MKGEIMPSIVKIDRAHLKELMYEVKETLATDFVSSNNQQKAKTFTAIDLWRIQQNFKSANLNFKNNF